MARQVDVEYDNTSIFHLAPTQESETTVGTLTEPVPTSAAGSFWLPGDKVLIPPDFCDQYKGGYDNISVFENSQLCLSKILKEEAEKEAQLRMEAEKDAQLRMEKEAQLRMEATKHLGDGTVCVSSSGSTPASSSSEPTPPSYPSSSSSGKTFTCYSEKPALSDITEEGSSTRFLSPTFLHFRHGNQDSQDTTPLRNVLLTPENPVFDDQESESPSSLTLADETETGTGIKPSGTTSVPVRYTDEAVDLNAAVSDAKPNTGAVDYADPVGNLPKPTEFYGATVEPVVSLDGNVPIPAYPHGADPSPKQMYRYDSVSSEPSVAGTISSMAVESGSNRDERSDPESSPDSRRTTGSDTTYSHPSCSSSLANHLNIDLDLEQPPFSYIGEGVVPQTNLSADHGIVQDTITGDGEKVPNKKKHVPDDREQDDLLVPKKLATGVTHKSTKATRSLPAYFPKRNMIARDPLTRTLWTHMIVHEIKRRQRQNALHRFNAEHSSPIWIAGFRRLLRLKNNEQMKQLENVHRNRKESASSDSSWEPASSAGNTGAGEGFSFEINPALPFAAPEGNIPVTGLPADMSSVSLGAGKCRYEEYGSDRVDPQQYFTPKKVSFKLPNGKTVYITIQRKST